MDKVLFNCCKITEKEAVDHFLTFDSLVDKQKAAEICMIGKTNYQKGALLEELNIIFRILRTEWALLESIALCDNVVPYEEIVYSRELINKIFEVLKESLLLSVCETQRQRYKASTLKEIISFLPAVIPLHKLEDDFMLKLITAGSSDKLPVHQYLHTLLEVQYYLMMLISVCDANEQVVQSMIKDIIFNIIIISKNNYKRKTCYNGQIFTCPCLKIFSYIIQLFCEKIGSSNTFWTLFNELMELEDPLFSLWLLRDLVHLQLKNSLERIPPNYDLLVQKLKKYLLNAESNTLTAIFGIIDPLVSNLWLKDAKIELFQVIWDYYSKRLNVSTKDYTHVTALEFNDILGNILWSSKNCSQHYEIFVGMLITHLKEHPYHWNKIKGRIYSQLGPNKIKELNETGLAHVMILFVALTKVNYDELLKKILILLESDFKERNSMIVWNIYTAFIFQQVKEGQKLERTAPPLLQMLQNACFNRDHMNFPFIKNFVGNFKHILNFSVNLQLDQWIFIDFWVPKYMNTCYYTDLKSTLELLLFTLEKVENPDCWSLWEPAFKCHVYPALKTLSYSQNPPDSIGTIAGKLCLLISQMSNEIFCFFNNDSMNANISSQFLMVVLQNPNMFMLSNQQQSLIVQSWMKICLLTTDSTVALTKNVLKLDIFPVRLKSHITNSRDPVHALIEYLGSDVEQHAQSPNIVKLCELSFGYADKWLAQYLSQPESEIVTTRIFVSISLAFLHCGLLLYSRNRVSCPLTKLLQSILLPSDLLIGKTLHPFVLAAVKKTWHLFFEAIVKLNADSEDMFLERTLLDMVTKYTPYFSSSDSPISKCIENEATAAVIFEKICSRYLKHPVKESDTNILKVLKILSDFLQSSTSELLVKLFVNKCLYGLFELVIFHSQRMTAINVIKILTNSPLYFQINTDFNTSVIAITERHLALNTINYFQLMYILAKFVPNDIKSLMCNIKQQMVNVERLRGVGFDKNLRLQFEKLESTVNENLKMRSGY